MSLSPDHDDIVDTEVWDPETGETFGEARARFATFGPELPAALVPQAVRLGLMVWSFGYGDDPADFTTIEESDLDSVDWDDPLDVAEWAPFRLDAGTPDAERIVLGIEPTVAPGTVGSDEPFAPALEAARSTQGYPSSTDALSRRTIVAALIGLDPANHAELPFGAQADFVLNALSAAGITLVAPDELQWGVCPDATDRDGHPTPHQVSLSLCSGCLQYDPS